MCLLGAVTLTPTGVFVWVNIVFFITMKLILMRSVTVSKMADKGQREVENRMASTVFSLF